MNRFAGSIPLIHSAASTEIMQLMLQFQKNEKLKTVIVDFYQYFKEKIKQHYGIAITCNIAALQPQAHNIVLSTVFFHFFVSSFSCSSNLFSIHITFTNVCVLLYTFRICSSEIVL